MSREKAIPAPFTLSENDLDVLSELCRVASQDLLATALLLESRMPISRSIEDMRMWAQAADDLRTRIESR